MGVYSIIINFVANDLLGLDNKFIDKTKDKKDIYVFISENGPKTNKIKGLFIKRMSVCY